MNQLNSCRPDFPTHIDSTMRSAFVACPTQFYNGFVLNRQSPQKSIHLVAGGALAKGFEVARLAFYQDNDSKDEAYRKGWTAIIREYGDPEDFLTHKDYRLKGVERMLLAYDGYWNHFGWETDPIQPYFRGGKVCVENTFALPIDVAHPQTGDPILYSGRFDFVGEYNNMLFAVDEKTMKQMGASWSQQFELRGQLIGYTWAARQYDFPVAGTVIRGICFYVKEEKFAPAIFHHPKWMIDKWYTQLCHDVKRMIRCWEEGYWDLNFGESCNSYGGCAFREACMSSRPEVILESDFVERQWNPLEKS